MVVLTSKTRRFLYSQASKRFCKMRVAWWRCACAALQKQLSFKSLQDCNSKGLIERDTIIRIVSIATAQGFNAPKQSFKILPFFSIETSVA